jgi:hypothetical protein
VQIKTKKHFSEIIKSLTKEIEEEDLDEITATGDVAGYNTPFAFTGKKGKKKKKKVATNSTGYKPVNEALDKKDIEEIRKLIKDVVGDIYRDIWLKRNSWK